MKLRVDDEGRIVSTLRTVQLDRAPWRTWLRRVQREALREIERMLGFRASAALPID